MNEDRPHLSATPNGTADVATIDGDDEPSALDILEPDFKAEPHGRVEIVADLTDDSHDSGATDGDLNDGDVNDAAHSSHEADSGDTDDSDDDYAEDIVEGAPSLEVADEPASDDLISELEADIDLVDATMAHLDNNDLDAADAAVNQLDRGAEPTLFAAVVPVADEAE